MVAVEGTVSSLVNRSPVWMDYRHMHTVLCRRRRGARPRLAPRMRPGRPGPTPACLLASFKHCRHRNRVVLSEKASHACHKLGICLWHGMGPVSGGMIGNIFFEKSKKAPHSRPDLVGPIGAFGIVISSQLRAPKCQSLSKPRRTEPSPSQTRKLQDQMQRYLKPVTAVTDDVR